MATFLLIFAVCFLVIGSMVGVMMLSRTPRYRTEAHDLLTLFDKALTGSLSETEWHTVIGYPVRHDEFLEGVRRRAQHLMDEHGRPWQALRVGRCSPAAGVTIFRRCVTTSLPERRYERHESDHSQTKAAVFRFASAYNGRLSGLMCRECQTDAQRPSSFPARYHYQAP